MHCISAIDNCLWSTRTQASVLPLAQLLGARRRDKVMAYTSTLFRSTPEGMAEAAQGYIEKGFRAVKFGWRVFGQDPARPRACRRGTRNAGGVVARFALGTRLPPVRRSRAGAADRANRPLVRHADGDRLPEREARPAAERAERLGRITIGAELGWSIRAAGRGAL